MSKINKIYFGLNGVLISPLEINEDKFDYGFRAGGKTHRCIINPYSWRLLEFSRNVVGSENVWLLTSCEREYAEVVNRFTLFRFPSSQILAKEDIENYVETCELKNNILIDNLPFKENNNKIIAVKIAVDNYLQVEGYRGIYKDGWKEVVEGFINSKHL